MKKFDVKKFLKRYRFFIALLLADAVLLFAMPELGKKSLTVSFDSFLEMLAILPPIFILMGLMDVWIPKETMMKYMGKGSGVKGSVISFILGSFSAGPLYAAFPVAAMFMKKGVSLVNIFIFVGAWSANKIPMMMFEVTQLGFKFAATRFALNLAGIVVIALIIDKTTSAEEYAKMEEAALKQIENK